MKSLMTSLAVVLSFSGGVLSVPVQAAVQAETHAYFIVRQPVAQFIEQLENDGGVQIDMSVRIQGMITNMRVGGDVEAILSLLSRRYGFHWFAFNNVFYVSPVSDARMRLVLLNGISSKAALQALAEAGLASDSFPITETSGGKALALTGPPKLLALSEAIIESLEPEVSESATASATVNVIAPASPSIRPRPVQPVQRDTLRLYRGTSLSVWQ